MAVTDHANLTWRSPLTGPNDDAVGPRFPSMTGVYAVEPIQERLRAVGGIIVIPGVVAGVGDDGRLNAYEAEIARGCGHQVASSELVQVVIVAAHMGMRVAAAVLC
jgi:purine nucleoside phosphorylase